MMARRWSSATATSGEAPARVEAPNRGGAMGAPPWRLGEERGRVGKKWIRREKRGGSVRDKNELDEQGRTVRP